MRTLLSTGALFASLLMGQGATVTQVVTNLDTSLAFYRDALGLQIAASRPFSPNAELATLFDASGVPSRSATLKIPDSDMTLELIEFQGLNAKPVRSHLSDFGAITVSYVVDDLEPIKARLNRIKGLEWISAHAGGVTVRDPDGFFVTLRRLRGYGGVEDPEAYLTVTVKDRNAAEDLFLNVLGCFVYYWQREDGFRGGARKSVAPADPLSIVFTDRSRISEYVPPDRLPILPEIHQAGAGVLHIHVTNFDATINALKAAGATVVSFVNRSTVLRDTNNLYLLIEETR